MSRYRDCDGVTRRDFLRVGSLGMAGLSLADHLRRADAGEAQGKARAAIFIDLSGGPSHLDSFDPKPDAPAEYRGSFTTIETAAPGVRFTEHLPKLAACADRFAVLRGVSHNVGDHSLGHRYLATGNRPLFTLDHPFYGAVATKELPCDRDIPAAVGLPFSSHGPGYLGIRYAPFDIGHVPQAGQPFEVNGIALGKGKTVKQLENWRGLRDDLDQTFAQFDRSDVLTGLDQFSQRAFDIIRSERSRKAFAMHEERPAVIEEFGDHGFGQSCLLACRLIEAGVRFVTIVRGGWDTHQDNFARLKNDLLPPLDQGVSALLRTLHSRGLLDSTLLLATGEFGRTPKINSKGKGGGRDHWPRAMFCLLAGAGIIGGRVHGASDAKGEGPLGDAISPDDVGATLYHALGIDPKREYATPSGRPITLIRDGQPLRQLWS